MAREDVVRAAVEPVEPVEPVEEEEAAESWGPRLEVCMRETGCNPRTEFR